MSALLSLSAACASMTLFQHDLVFTTHSLPHAVSCTSFAEPNHSTCSESLNLLSGVPKVSTKPQFNHIGLTEP